MVFQGEVNGRIGRTAHGVTSGHMPQSPITIHYIRFFLCIEHAFFLIYWHGGNRALPNLGPVPANTVGQRRLPGAGGVAQKLAVKRTSPSPSPPTNWSAKRTISGHISMNPSS